MENILYSFLILIFLILLRETLVFEQSYFFVSIWKNISSAIILCLLIFVLEYFKIDLFKVDEIFVFYGFCLFGLLEFIVLLLKNIRNLKSNKEICRKGEK